MSAIMSMFARPYSFATTPNSEMFETSSTQKFVKDEVVFAPTPDPYLAFSNAVEKLSTNQYTVLIETNDLKNE